MKTALVLILFAVGYRLVAAFNPEMANFSPLMALAFCGAVYFTDKRLWLVPFAALALSDLFLNWHYAQMGYGWEVAGMLTRTACFAAALGLGWLVSRRKNWLNLFSGCLAGSLLFYFATNTVSWAVDPFYMKSAAGWWQAMTVGHPTFPPTLYFFRNTLIGDLLFTGLFALALEYAALKARQPSLLRTATVRIA